MHFTWILSCILSAATLAHCEGLAIVGCNSDGSMSVEDHVKDFLLVCGNLDMTSNTFWTFQDRDTSHPRQIISNCSTQSSSSSAPVWSCVSTFNVMIKTAINEHTRRSHVILPDMSVGRFPDGTWRCENGDRVAECFIDVVYTPKDVKCHVTIDEDRSAIKGTCHISKMFSSHGKYSCQWFEKNGNQSEVAVRTSQTEFSRSDCSEGGVVYYCGNCSFSKVLPAVSESYGYRVLILPGNISPSVEFTVKPKADAPSSPQTQLPPNSSVAVVDEDAVNAALLKGIGIGVGSLLAALLLIAAITFAVWKWRNTSREGKDDDSEIVPKQPAGTEGSRGSNRAHPAQPDFDGYHTPVDINPTSQASGNGIPQPLPVAHTWPSRPRDNEQIHEDGYHTPVDINPTSQASGNGIPQPLPVACTWPSRPRDNEQIHEDEYLTPIDINPTSQASSNGIPQPLPVPHPRPARPRDNAQIREDDSETVSKQPAGNEGSNRALPALPASGRAEANVNSQLTIANSSSNSE